jgi:hypothetical protein
LREKVRMRGIKGFFLVFILLALILSAHRYAAPALLY